MSLTARSAALILAAGMLCTQGPIPAGAEEVALSGSEFVSPWNGSLIVGGPIVLAGRLPPGASAADFLLNGRPLPGISVRGRSFSGTFIPPKGVNELEVRQEGASSRLIFIYGRASSGRLPYTFHKPLLEGDCRPCHRDARRDKATTEAEICYGCHSSMKVIYPFLHGPLAAGKCLVCHDPHGSSLPALNRKRPLEMCTSCHDQPTTVEHVSTSRSRMCVLCHNPHYGMNRALLRATL